MVHSEGLFHLVVVARVVGFAGGRVGRGYYGCCIFFGLTGQGRGGQAGAEEVFESQPERGWQFGGVAGFGGTVWLFHEVIVIILLPSFKNDPKDHSPQ